MPDVHPHWQSTGEDAPVPVHVRPCATNAVRINSGSVSRIPGAVIGIILVLTVGVLLSQGGEELLQDLLSLPSQFITFVQPKGNSSLLAQVADSGTSSLSSVASSTDPASSSDPLQGLSSSSYSSEAFPVQESSSSSSSEKEPSLGNAVEIPRNPYTVTGVVGRTYPPASNLGSSYGSADAPLRHSGAPPAQPASGPETWMVLVASLAAMIWTSRVALCPIPEHGTDA